MRAECLFANKWETQAVTRFDQLFDEFFFHADGEWELPDLLLCLQKSPLWNAFKTFQAFSHGRVPGSGVGYRFEGSHKIWGNGQRLKTVFKVPALMCVVLIHQHMSGLDFKPHLGYKVVIEIL